MNHDTKTLVKAAIVSTLAVLAFIAAAILLTPEPAEGVEIVLNTGNHWSLIGTVQQIYENPDNRWRTVHLLTDDGVFEPICHPRHVRACWFLRPGLKVFLEGYMQLTGASGRRVQLVVEGVGKKGFRR